MPRSGAGAVDFGCCKFVLYHPCVGGGREPRYHAPPSLVDYGRAILVADGVSLMEPKGRSLAAQTEAPELAPPEIERILSTIIPPRYQCWGPGNDCIVGAQFGSERGSP